MVTHTTDAALVGQIRAVFERYHAFTDVELQQRSVEYSQLASLDSPLLQSVLSEMPVFPERSSRLEKLDAPGESAVHARQPPPSSLPLSGNGSAGSPGPLLLGDIQTPRRAPLEDPLLALQLVPAANATAVPGLSGLDDFFASASTAPVERSVPPLQDPALWLSKLATADSGVLYEGLSCGPPCIAVDRHLSQSFLFRCLRPDWRALGIQGLVWSSDALRRQQAHGAADPAAL
jgi:hypothetical protein